jgi:hypothetical protein
VEDGEAFMRATTGSLVAEPWVRTIVVHPIGRSAGSPEERFRFYRGRRHSDAPDGPFSFVPTQTAESAPRRFSRPVVRLDRRWLTPGLRQGTKATPASERESAPYGTRSLGQVRGAGLETGIGFDIPPERDAAVD